MTTKRSIYKCGACGNIVEVVHPGPGELVCCGTPMALLDEKEADQTTEKHVPVIEKVDCGYRVVVGSTLHPMEENHYIEWIELQTEDRTYRQYLAPGAKPEACFCVEADSVTAREYCNLHGLWKS